jgi:hypothetical protein
MWGRGANVTPGPQGFNGLTTEHTNPPYNRFTVHRPPITIRCECGETKDVAYGERWRCGRCGRSWNTQQIPAEEYEGLLRRMRRHKIEALAAVAISAAVLIPLIVIVSSRYILLVPTVMAAWLFVALPFWRRRYRRTARGAPRWELHPE